MVMSIVINYIDLTTIKKIESGLESHFKNKMKLPSLEAPKN
jgi:hypothetical protein